MLSRLYKGSVTHHRREPFHGFSYPVWYAWINLDEVDEFCKLSPWISRERFNFLSFYRQDYLPGSNELVNSVSALIEDRTGQSFSGQIYLLTTLRQMGYVMNPLSLYYCYEEEGEERVKLKYVVAEVHNTPWGERHTYLIEPQESDRSLQEKQFHVSPFMPMDLTYEFYLPLPEQELEIGIRLLKQNLPVFNATLNLQSLPANGDTIKQMLASGGWQSLCTIFRIYLQALKLWMKKARFFPHPSKQAPGYSHLKNSPKSLRKNTT